MDPTRRRFLSHSAGVSAIALAGPTLLRTAPAVAQGGSGRELATMTIVELSRLLASRKITSRQLVEQSLAAIRDPQGEGARTFLLVHDNEALAAADRVDAQRRGGATLPALAGIPLSIKDLFDEAGVVTLGGSKVLVGTPPATRDSTVVERLRKRRRDNCRPHEPCRVRVLVPRHQPTLRHTEKRLRSSHRPHSWWFDFGWSDLGHRRHGGRRDRHRYRRIGPHPGRAERPGRFQTHRATCTARRRSAAVVYARFGWADRQRLSLTAHCSIR